MMMGWVGSMQGGCASQKVTLGIILRLHMRKRGHELCIIQQPGIDRGGGGGGGWGGGGVFGWGGIVW